MEPNPSRLFPPCPPAKQKIEKYKYERRNTTECMTLPQQLETLKRDRIERSLEVLFTPWQGSILRKRAEGIPLTNAERQELSRRIKPKIMAIDDLRDLKLLLPALAHMPERTEQS